MMGGSTETERQRTAITGKRVYIKAEQVGEGQHSQANLSQGGGYNETLRRRADITAKREQFDRAGVAQIGINGEETASPG